MSGLEGGVDAVIVFLFAALVVGIVAERIGIPYSVALLLASLPLELPRMQERFGPTLLFVFLPALIFEAAWNVDAAALRRRWATVVVLAVPGVVITAVVVALGLSLAGALPFLPALLLGAILASTDPIVVTAVFRNVTVPADLAGIVEGESLLNDGAAIALYGIVLAAIVAGQSTVAPGAIAMQTVVVALGGTVIGFVVAFVLAVLIATALPTNSSVLFQVVGTVVAAYGGYAGASALHFSGIFAAVVAGVALRAFKRFPTTERAGVAVGFFWSAIAFLANTLVFLGMGLTIDVAHLFGAPALMLLTLGLVAGTRAVLTYGVLRLPSLGVSRLPWQHVIYLAGMRGAVSVALALGLPASVPHRAQIVDTVFGVVLLTLVVQGLSIGPVLRRLRLA